MIICDESFRNCHPLLCCPSLVMKKKLAERGKTLKPWGMEMSQTLSSVFIHLCKESEESNLSISAFAAYAIFERKLFTL